MWVSIACTRPYCEGRCDNMHFSRCDCNLHDDPVFSYRHNYNAQSIIGGHVYRGTQFPSKYNGAYFYADFVQKHISYLTFESDGSTKVKSNTKFMRATDGITSKPTDLVFDNKGSLWYLAQAPNSQRMEVWRVSWSNPHSNAPPSIGVVSASTTAGRYVNNVMPSDCCGSTPSLWQHTDGARKQTIAFSVTS